MKLNYFNALFELDSMSMIELIENKMNFYQNLNFKNFETNPLIIEAKSDIK